MLEKRIEISGTVENWFQQSLQLIKACPELTRADNLLASVLLCARKHTISILLLLANDHRLPAQALSRVLCELYAKLVWSSGASKRLSKDDIYQRFQRWDYSRVIEHRRILRNLSKSYPNLSKINASLDKAEASIKEYEDRGVKPVPKTAEIFKELAQVKKEWVELTYPRIYQDYSAAIHSDMRILRQLVEYDRIGSWRHDIDYPIDELRSYCISMACDINLVVRDHYQGTPGISSKMQDEYKEMIEEK